MLYIDSKYFLIDSENKPYILDSNVQLKGNKIKSNYFGKGKIEPTNVKHVDLKVIFSNGDSAHFFEKEDGYFKTRKQLKEFIFFKNYMPGVWEIADCYPKYLTVGSYCDSVTVGSRFIIDSGADNITIFTNKECATYNCTWIDEIGLILNEDELNWRSIIKEFNQNKLFVESEDGYGWVGFYRTKYKVWIELKKQ